MAFTALLFRRGSRVAALVAAARPEDPLALMLPAAPARVLSRALAVAVVCPVSVLAAAGPATAADPVGAVLDRTQTAPVAVPKETARAQERLRRKLGARALLQSDPSTGTPRIVARLDGFLTAPSTRDPEAIALEYVREHSEAFGLDAGDIAGLRLRTRERGPEGTVQLTWEQRSGGLPNVDGGLHAAVTAGGRLLNIRGAAIPDPDAATPEPRVSAAQAYATALPGSTPAPSTTSPKGAERVTEFVGGGRASLVRYRDAGSDRVGWRLLIPAGSSAFYDAIVDARTGRLQRRINRVRFASQIRHFLVNPRTPENNSGTLSPIPDAWLGPEEHRLKGPYVHAVSDLDDSIFLVHSSEGYALSDPPGADDEVTPSSENNANRVWDYPPELTFCAALCSWSSSANASDNRKFSTGQLFWYVNTYRDHLVAPPIAFTGSGEFKDDDAVLAQALDGANTGPDETHLSNANMLVLPDGFPGLMQMYLFAPPVLGRYDGAMDASIVYHEYTHGLSERLVTDSQGFGSLIGPQPGAISEGTSDFYAMDYLADAQPSLVPDTDAQGEIRVGRWLQTDPNLKGTDAFRTEGLDCEVPPSDIDMDHCPGAGTAGPGGYAYDDFGRVLDTPEVHADGEIWAQTLWALRQALIEVHANDLAPEHPKEGLWRTRAYVTGGLRLAPENPTFLDMRNAIVQAAFSLHGDEDWDTIWQVFAERGMGWTASTDGPNDLTPFAAGGMPPAPNAPTPRGRADGTVTDEIGAPVADARVAIAGHDSGLGVTDLQTTTGADGRYTLPLVALGTYPDLYVRKPGFQELTTGLTVQAPGTVTTNFAPLRRDYASTSSGGSVFSFTGSNFTGDGCGPAQAIDDDKGTVWSTEAHSGAKDLVIDFGRRIDLREVRIDPRAGCGDGPEASLAQYELAASDGAGQPFERIAGGVVGAPDARGYVTLPLAGTLAARRLLRLRAIAPRDLESPFMDISELEVTGTPVPIIATPPAAPTPTPQATPTPTPQPSPPRLTALASTKLTANRKGFFRVKVAFGDAAPLGTARLTVLRKGKRLARVTTAVRRALTVTKTLRLSKKGRRVIRAGQTKRVTLELRLPDGQKIKRSMKLTRRRR